MSLAESPNPTPGTGIDEAGPSVLPRANSASSSVGSNSIPKKETRGF
jgi:hypothetical protein